MHLPRKKIVHQWYFFRVRLTRKIKKIYKKLIKEKVNMKEIVRFLLKKTYPNIVVIEIIILIKI